MTAPASRTTRQSTPRQSTARRVYEGLAWSLVGAILAQVALAGLGAFDLPEAWLWHRRFANVVEASALLMLLVALIWRLRGLRWRAALLLLLIASQHGLAAIGGIAGALHAMNALVLMLLAHRAGYQASREAERLPVGAVV